MTDSPSLTEEEILELVDGAVQLPKTVIWDTIARRLERYEPLAADIETLLSANDFVGCVDKATGQAARRSVYFLSNDWCQVLTLRAQSSRSFPGRTGQASQARGSILREKGNILREKICFFPTLGVGRDHR